jgi:hypothetical protein
VARCKYCSKPNATFIWGPNKYKFCHSCNSRLFAIWEATYVKKKWPGLEVYADSKELDDIVDLEGEKRKLLKDFL